MSSDTSGHESWSGEHQRLATAAQRTAGARRASRALLWIGLLFVFAQLVGSAFNIWYNLLHIEPLLTPSQHRRFAISIFWVNALLYPAAMLVGARILASVNPLLRAFAAGETPDQAALDWARARCINFPWYGLALAGTCWLSCIPLFLGLLWTSPEPLDPRVGFHLPMSLLIGGSIAVSIGFSCLEWGVQRWLYPVLFAGARPHGQPGAYPLTLRGRGVMWVCSSCVSPIACLLLLMLEPASLEGRGQWFALSAGMIAILFGLLGAWMSSHQILEPIEALRRVAGAVREGKLNVSVDVLRADEFGPLIGTVNDMLHELREKQRIEDLFGRHVGQTAARRIMQELPGTTGGVDQDLTVLFADLRGFTARSQHLPAPEVVRLLNRFFGEMVDVIEQAHAGMVNKFLGDGLMALFGVIPSEQAHADVALRAAVEMQTRLERLNHEWDAEGLPPLKMGIGLCSGSAVVGSLGSARRGEFTAIGSTVNLASRIEALTKETQLGILLADTTCERLTADYRAALGRQLRELAPTAVRGWDHPITLYGMLPPDVAEKSGP